MSTSIETTSLDFVAATGKALEEANKIADTLETTMAKLAEAAPTLAKQLVDLKIIDSTVHKTAIERLQDPVKLAEIFGNVLKHVAKKEAGTTAKSAADLGTAVPTPNTKTANDNYVGRRRPLSERAGSDEPLRKMAGLS